jgi:hypothetical protein
VELYKGNKINETSLVRILKTSLLVCNLIKVTHKLQKTKTFKMGYKTIEQHHKVLLKVRGLVDK